MHRPRQVVRRFASLIAALTLAVPMVVSPVAAPTVAAASDPNGISFTLEGCNLDHGGTYNASTNTCSDSAYTTGNLGKSWAELDLVPLRFTVASGNSPNQTYSFVVGGDYLNGAATHNGWDYIGPGGPVLDTSLSDAACTAATFGPLAYALPGVGGAYETIYRLVTLTQQTGTTCVYNYYQRLALGAHLFSGSSLQAHLWNQSLNSSGIGEKRVQLPVSQLLPPTLTKDMTASQNEDNIWTLAKTPVPASLDFGDVCAVNALTSLPVTVTVQWTKTAGTPGRITVITHVYGTNVAHRDLTLTATDVVYSGTTPLYTVDGSPTNVPANQTVLLLSDTRTVDPGTANLNDSATAAITDTVTGIPVPGTIGPVTATASPTTSGTNDTATITDSESITGSGLAFSVATPSVGSFTDYTAGTSTTGPVDWSSGTRSASGSVGFSKTVTLSPLQVTSGTLSDTATLNGSDGFTVDATADIGITSTAAVTLTINKTIPNILQGAETQTFDFVVKDSTDATAGTASITFAAGEYSKHVDVPNLSPGTYTVSETTATGWNPQDDQQVTITGCSGSVNFENTFAPASASAVKVTVPAGQQAGWTMVLTGPGTPLGGEQLTTDATGTAAFATALQEGSYTITEVAQTGWDQTSATGDCSFTVDYPADFGTTFTCTFNNTERGNIALIKTFQGGAIPAGDTFTFQVRQNATSASDGTVLSTVDVTSGTTFPVNLIAPNSLVPGAYQVCELLQPGWGSTITTMTGHFEPNGGVSGYFCVPVTVTAGQTTTLTIDNTPPPGGVALTIGYWKTHSCQAPGKQADVLTATLTGHGFLVGSLLVDTCNEAVSLLSKTPIGATKNAASDPAFNFAAQYVAYKLNLLAGAADKTTAANAAANGQSILVAISFNGVTHTGISPAQKSALLADASILDKYNNNSL